jgi:hypothetical protein
LASPSSTSLFSPTATPKPRTVFDHGLMD